MWQLSLVLLMLPVLPGCTETSDTTRDPQATSEVRTALDCPSTPTPLIEGGHLDYGADAEGSGDDPVQVVRDWLGDSLQGKDLRLVSELETRATVAVERDGAVIALVDVRRASAGGGFLIDSYQACAGALSFP